MFSVCRKNIISSLRGEYVDFVISRFTFTLFTMATAVVLFKIQAGNVSSMFIGVTGNADYLGFMIVGTALYGTTHGILLNVSRTLMTERREGTLEAVLIIPFSRWVYYGGNQLYQLILTAFDTLLAIVLASVLGINFHVNLLNTAASLFQLFITLYGLALLVSLLMISLRDTFFIQNTIIPIVLLTGGYLFPVEALPVPLKVFARFVPVHKGVYGIREAVLQGIPFVPDPEYFISLVPGFVFLAAGFLLLPRIERKAIENYLS